MREHIEKAAPANRASPTTEDPASYQKFPEVITLQEDNESSESTENEVTQVSFVKQIETFLKLTA